MAKVVVFLKASAESTTALLTAGSEGCREPPLLIVPAVAGLLLHVVLVPIGAVDARALVSSMSKLVNQAISKVAKHVTVIFFHEFTIGVGLPDQVGSLLKSVITSASLKAVLRAQTLAVLGDIARPVEETRSTGISD